MFRHYGLPGGSSTTIYSAYVTLGHQTLALTYVEVAVHGANMFNLAIFVPSPFHAETLVSLAVALLSLSTELKYACNIDLQLSRNISLCSFEIYHKWSVQTYTACVQCMHVESLSEPQLRACMVSVNQAPILFYLTTPGY